MNFKDLLDKIKSIDESEGNTDDVNAGSDASMAMQPTEIGEQPNTVPQGGDTFLVGEEGQVNISMSMEDLLSLMSRMEKGHDGAVVVGMEETGEDGGFGDATTTPEPNTADISAVTPTGDDLASKGDEAEKANGGGNPWNQKEVSEGLVEKLAQHYQEVKAR